ncbi:MAG: GNAT family N-acetyltransferase [Verrucomicrobiales bacterium]
MITFRQNIADDLPELSQILAATVGNSHALGAGMKADWSGWVACRDGSPVGFAMADCGQGELLTVAVLPEFCGKGIGRELMKQAEAWLFSHGWAEIRFSIPEGGCDQALGFFQRLAWVDGKAQEGHRQLEKKNPRTTINLEEHVITDGATGYSRLLRLQRGPSDQAHRLCLFLDGEHYWRDMDAVPVLNDLLSTGILPPMTFALVGHVSGAARHVDYTCNEQYSRFIGDAVMPWLQKEVVGLQQGGHILCGLSLSGLMAVYLTLQYPEHFGYCLSQSGSHWWKHEWFAEMARQQNHISARFWLSVGDQEIETDVRHPPTGLLQEISQIEGVNKAAQTLEAIGGTVYLNQYHGGHSTKCWREELGDALLWLINEGGIK